MLMKEVIQNVMNGHEVDWPLWHWLEVSNGNIIVVLSNMPNHNPTHDRPAINHAALSPVA